MLNVLAYEIPLGATQTVEHLYHERDNVNLEQIKFERDLQALGLRPLGGFRSAPAARPGWRYLWCYAGPADRHTELPRGHR